MKRFDGRNRPLSSANGISKDALYFLMEETTANVWLAEPMKR